MAFMMCLALADSLAAQPAKLDGKVTGPAFAAIDLGKFSHSIVIDNKWAPMRPGMRWIYEGSSVEDDGKTVPHRVIITITDLTKVLSGVRTVVSYDLDYTDGELKEAELAFFAQDDVGNVWQFGEYPEEYEDGKVITAPAWIHGIQGSRAGIMMPAEPQADTPSFSEGWGPAVGWKDRGSIYLLHQKVSVPAGTYGDILVIKESAAGEKDAEQLKYYSSGTGNVRTGWLGTGTKVTETLELISLDFIDAKMVAEARINALKLEQSAFRHSKNVYATTKPSTHKVDRTER